MASLKDMRVRIAATKATQKITKAMQMVAASKLRRAQAAAEAARPYAERMEAVLRNIAAGIGRLRRRAEAAGRHRQRQGASADRRHRRARPCRRLQFLDRAAGARAHRAAAGRGQRGQDPHRRQEGLTSSCAATYEKQIVDRIELRGVRVLGYVNAAEIAGKVIAMFERGEFDVATLFYSRFKSVIAQIPTAQQIIPPKFEAEKAKALRRLTNTSRRKRTSSPICCRAMSRRRFSARCSRTPPRSTARRCRRWTTRPATPAT